MMFSVKKITYLYDTTKQQFVKLAGLDNGVPCEVFHQYKALTAGENFMRFVLYSQKLAGI